MKFVKMALGVVLVGGLLAGTVPAQNNLAYPSPDPAYRAVPVRQAGYANVSDLFAAPGEAGASPSDAASAVAAAVAPVAHGASCGSCDPCGDVCSDPCDDPCNSCSACRLGDPWTLFGETSSGISVGGWVSFGGYTNEYNTPTNGTLGMNNVADGFTMNQLWGFIEKAVDTGGYGWDVGGRIDYVFGVDGPDTQAYGDVGWDTTWDTARDYGSAIPQLYGEIGYNDWTVKAGHFYTTIGYEVVQAPDNFFYSHAYTFYYGEPFTHTGALATYSGVDNWTFYGGWTMGWDTGFNNSQGASTFLGGASYHLCDDASVTYMVSAGDFGSVADGDIYFHSIVLEVALLENLTWIIQNDLGVQSTPRGENRWGGVNQYLLYEVNDYWSYGMRFEWFNDRDGSRGLGPAGNYYNCTAGINWRPHANFVFRPEIRVDWFGGTAVAGNLPFDEGQRDEQLSGGFDAIFTF